MPKYKVEEKQYLGGMREVTITRQMTVEDAIKGGAMAAGMLMGAYQSSQMKAAMRQAQEAFAAIENGDADTAIKKADALSAMKDRDAQIMGPFLKGLALLLDENMDGALRELSLSIERAESAGAMERAPETMHVVLLSRGQCYLEKGQLQKALQDFTRVIQMVPNHDIGYFCRGQALRRLGDLTQALADLNHAIEIDPSSATNYRERGRIYADCHESSRALDDYNRAITLDATSATTFTLRGDLYMEMGEYQKAIADYSEAIRLTPDQIECYRKRAEAHRLAENSAAAEADLAHVAQQEPLQRAYQAYLNASRALTAQGITRVYSEADTRVRWHVLSCLAFVVAGVIVAILTVVAVFVLGRSDLLILVPIGLLLFTGLSFWGGFKEASERAQLSQLYMAAVTRNQQTLPGFSEFFALYLQARKAADMQNLPKRTRVLFQRGGPAYAALTQYGVETKG